MQRFSFIFALLLPVAVFSQTDTDSLDNERLSQIITLSEVVVRSDLNVPDFIKKVKEDTTFYKAFKNLRVLGYTSLNSIQIFDKGKKIKASLESKTTQRRIGKCRVMDVLQEQTTGNFYTSRKEYRYYTAELYASFFFTQDTVCSETNIIGKDGFSIRSKKGFSKHKEQLKMLFFNPGKKIPGIPFIGDKINLFDPDNARLYDFHIDEAKFDGQSAYLFTVKAKEGLSTSERNKIVIDKMTTWFDARSMDVLGRNWTMSYNAGVYNFNVQMEVELTRLHNYLVPKTLRYTGSWKVLGKGKETSAFTATLFDFNMK